MPNTICSGHPTKSGRAKNPGFFRNVQVETGGYAVFWNEEIDISEYELWTHGKDSLDQAITAAQALITEAVAQKQAVLEKYL